MGIGCMTDSRVMGGYQGACPAAGSWAVKHNNADLMHRQKFGIAQGPTPLYGELRKQLLQLS